VTEAPSTPLASELAACLARFSEDRAGCTRLLAALLDRDRQGFAAQAVAVLSASALPSEPERALLSLLIQQGYVTPVLMGVYAADRIRFQAVLSAAHTVEPRLSARITKRLTELLGQEHLDRIDEILCLFDAVVQVNGMANLAGALPHLQKATDPRLRARAALLDASLPNGRHLLELYRDERDPRVRAGIVESLWLNDQPIARLVFEEARRDLHPRVRSYGLLGLYRLGDPRVLADLAGMAESNQALNRAVARGAIELLRDPRLDTLLSRLRMEFGEAQTRSGPLSPAVRYGRRAIHLAVPRVRRLPSGRLCVQFSARHADEEPLDPPLRPLDVRTWVDDQPVLSYSVTRLVPARRLGIGVVFPLSLRAGCESTPGVRRVLDALESLPGNELRSAGFYRSGLFLRQEEEDETGPDPPPVEPALRQPFISQDAFRFAADLKDASREEHLAPHPGELTLAMLNRLKALKPAGHIVVMLDEAVAGPPGAPVIASLRQGLRESGCLLHVVGLDPVAAEVLNPWLALSRDCGGFQARISSEDELPDLLHGWLLCARESYCVEFGAPPSASRILLQVVHPIGAGEITAPVQAAESPSSGRSSGAS